MKPKGGSPILMTIHNFEDHKNKKKFTKVIEDIDSILRVISLTQKSLSYFKQYLTVQEIVSVLETNKTLLELYRKKYGDKLEEIEKKYSKSSEGES